LFEYEQVQARRGPRSGFPIIVAIHSTELGPAAGGCRLWRYPDWRDGLTDALRLAKGMTLKNATANLAHGGGKTVIALPLGTVLDDIARRDVLLDVGDFVESFGGQYATGPDVGTSTEDMAVIGERTRRVFCRPESLGGSGDPSEYTATGVHAAIGAACRVLDDGHAAGTNGGATNSSATNSSADTNCGATDGRDGVRGRRITLVGLGHVGSQLAGMLARDGARLTVTDLNPGRRALGAELGAAWCEPSEALTIETDLLVPAALGGQFTAELVPALRCRAIVGAANNQLAEDSVAELLHRRGIHWVPDYLASAGGVVYAVARELHGAGLAEAVEQVRGIGAATEELLRTAARLGTNPHRAALRQLADRLGTGSHAEIAPASSERAVAGAPMMS